MKLKRYIHIILFALLLSCKINILYATDTLRVNQLHRKLFHDLPLVIKTSPTAFLWGGVFPYSAEYRLMLEMPSAKRQSDQVSASLLGKSILLNGIEKILNLPLGEKIKVKGYRLQYAHKFYLVGRNHYAPYGFYVAPLISYTDTRVSLGLNRYYQNIYYDLRNFNMDVMLGVQAGKINHVTLDLYWGLGYKSNKAYYHTSSNQFLPYDTKDFGVLYNSHLNGVFGINIGYSL